MLNRLIAGLNADAPSKLVATTVARLAGQPSMVVLDTLHVLLQDGLAQAAGDMSARRWVDAVAPAAERVVAQATAELACGDDNAVRRNLTAKRLILLTEQLANTCYVEAVRVLAAQQRGGARAISLVEWVSGYFHWLGHAHTARAMLDAQAALPWEGVCSLFLALNRHALLPPGPALATTPALRSLAYLLLVHDAFPLAGEHRVAAAALVASHLDEQVLIAAEFHRRTPLRMLPAAGESQRLVGWEDTVPALYYGLEAVATEVSRWASEAVAEPLPAALAGINDAPALLRQLVHGWVEQPGRRRHPLLRERQEAHAAFDWRRIRGLLGQKTARIPANDPLIYLLQLDDADEGGASLLVPDKVAPLLAEGPLALRIGGRWWLATPLRMEREPNGNWFVVLRWLAQEAEPVRLTSSQGEAWRGVYLRPGPANQYQASLLADGDSLQPGQSCGVEIGNRTESVVVESREAVGRHLWRYRVKTAD